MADSSAASESQTIAQLRQRVEDLETENARLRASCHCHQSSRAIHDDGVWGQEQEDSTTAVTVPSYMRPTNSSRSRAREIAEKVKKLAQNSSKKLVKVRVDNNSASKRPSEAGAPSEDVWPSSTDFWEPSNIDSADNALPADGEEPSQAASEAPRPNQSVNDTVPVTWEGTRKSALMQISTKFSLDALTQAHQLVKESLHEAAQRS
ncbi:hypothetical protein B0T22DRAFT_444973 [Podospora appendiculata]|uniref:Uncharacterized protein n=1 Tax=Podospora appendiculata TaxID=314037 RepID=A0AAE0X1M5_9PEZI|nr:hypothetical protein B0T22DRAFT_444973 [Podospora appendiculata]